MVSRSRAGWPSALYVCLIVATIALWTVSWPSPLAAQKPSIRSAHHPSTASTVVSSIQRQAVERTWREGEIGSPKENGASAWNGAVLAVTGSGNGFGNATDQAHFTYTLVHGDADVVGRLLAKDSTHPLASAGILIRSSLAAGAAYAGLIETNQSGMQFERRLVDGWSALTTESGVASPHLWMKLERRGPMVTAYVSLDGVNWTTLGADAVDLGADVYAGFAVAGHRGPELATATFDEISIRRLDSDPAEPDAAPERPPADNGASSPEPGTKPVPPPVVDQGNNLPPPQAVQEPPVVEPPPPVVVLPEPPPSPVIEPPHTAEPLPPVILEPEPPPPVVDPEPAPPPPAPEPVQPSTLPPVPDTTPAPSPVPSALQYLVFEPSADHDTDVVSYLFEVWRADTSTVMSAYDIGKPAVETGECRVDVGGWLAQLPTGSYMAVVKAVNSYGTSVGARSAIFTLP